MARPEFEDINPSTEEVIETYEGHETGEVIDAVEKADDAFDGWSDRSIEERESLLADVAEVLRDNTDEYAETMTREMGKPVSEARSEVEKCAWVCDYYAERAGEHLQDDRIGTEPGARTYVSYEPLGVVLAIMPWNFPFWQVFRFAVPYLTAGNVGILKHASNVPGCALAIEEVFDRAGYPDGVFTTVLAETDAVEPMLEHDAVRAVTLTGSNRAGSAVGETAGREIKKTVLELGGSDPFVVLDDADVDEAARVGARSRNLNSGQSCIAAKRFVVHQDVYEGFLERFVEEVEALNVGDPTDEDVDVGSQARGDLRDELHGQVRDSVEAGAEAVVGGEPLDREGYYYPPTVLTDVPDGCPASEEELFGPVAAVFRVSDEDEAIDRANDSPYGLGASIWTDDVERGERVAGRIKAGSTFVNELVKSDPRLPFGGVKKSGYGRELGRDGIREFTNRKTVWVQEAGE
ncbi:NAD-dependent succinate-semialdehyde dehydrogenase [Haladaptatus sp. F3-133]|uniref:NAD-dependent succinate-semialdehyde dehydrogenase n=1 Tax=Halorutilus salinus TaxID=2487751 RepID=A0A9Q4C4I0_9EURY|nr:NAD-dependent succinate-semialdehyde dehydrogenase [Halorutilus salinus]MCX2819705.1 NAD-dependent succinate-semialdehyde dehydrogenase [Halorutilus salinus]